MMVVYFEFYGFVSYGSLYRVVHLQGKELLTMANPDYGYYADRF